MGKKQTGLLIGTVNVSQYLAFWIQLLSSYFATSKNKELEFPHKI